MWTCVVDEVQNIESVYCYTTQIHQSQKESASAWKDLHRREGDWNLSFLDDYSFKLFYLPLFTDILRIAFPKSSTGSSSYKGQK